MVESSFYDFTLPENDQSCPDGPQDDWHHLPQHVGRECNQVHFQVSIGYDISKIIATDY